MRPIWEPAEAHVHVQIGHWWNTGVYKRQLVHTSHVTAWVQGPRAEISEPGAQSQRAAPDVKLRGVRSERLQVGTLLRLQNIQSRVEEARQAG